MQVARYILLLCAMLMGNVSAASPWRTTWGESFNSVKAKYPEATILDMSAESFCKGSSAEACQMRQVILNRSVVGGLPARVIFGFSPEAKLKNIHVYLDEVEKYTPNRLGIAYTQLQLLLEKEYGKAVGAPAFSLRPDLRLSKGLSGKATSIWHTDDSIISLNISVFGTDSEDTPTKSSFFYISYMPLELIGK